MSVDILHQRLQIIRPFLQASERDTCENFIRQCEAAIANREKFAGQSLSERSAKEVDMNNKSLTARGHSFYLGVYTTNESARAAIGEAGNPSAAL
jgi:hypothetical protein